MEWLASWNGWEVRMVKQSEWLEGHNMQLRMQLSESSDWLIGMHTNLGTHFWFPQHSNVHFSFCTTKSSQIFSFQTIDDIHLE